MDKKDFLNKLVNLAQEEGMFEWCGLETEKWFKELIEREFKKLDGKYIKNNKW